MVDEYREGLALYRCFSGREGLVFWLGMALAFLLAVPAGAANTPPGDNGSAPVIPDPLAITGNGNSTSPGTLAVPGVREAATPSPVFMTVRPLAGGTWSLYTPGQKIGIAATGTGGILLAGTNGSITLQLAGIGRPDDFQVAGPGKPRASVGRIDIVRSGYTEWYAGSSAGIEQGMTVDSRPPGNGTLIVNYTLAGDLSPVLADRTLVFSDTAGPVMNYGGLAAHDAAGRELPAMLSLSPGTITWQIDDSNAVYPVVIDPWIATQDAVLTAKDAAKYAYFGSSVGISGNTAIVGAYDAGVGTNATAGQAYVFTNSGGTWSQSAILNATDAAAKAHFGSSVGISGNTAIVGAYNATTGSNTSAGQAYVFTNSGGAWSQSAILNATDAEAGANFGNSVAVSGNGDLVVIGALNATARSKYSAGQAYVFTNSGGTWSQSALLNATDADVEANFGNSVAISGNGNLAVIGAPYATAKSTSYAGQAYVFTNSGGTWSQSAILNATDAEENAGFGNSVAISGNGNLVVIAAPFATVKSTSYAGQAYVFTNSGGTWSQSAILNATDAEKDANFGYSVGISEDTAIIGAFGANSKTGKAYVFKEEGGAWNRKILLNGEAQNDLFGSSVALSTDGNRSIIGAYGANSSTGKAYVYDIISSVPIVYGIAPTSGPNTTSTQVVVSGNGFNSTVAPALRLTRTGYSNVSPKVTSWSITASSFRATVPAGLAAGVWNVTVINPDGEEGTNASVTFTVTAVPELTGISPSYATNTAPTLVTITGNQFSTAGAPVVNLTQSGYHNITMTGTNLTPASFTASVPQEAGAGTWNVVVTNPDGQEAANSSVNFTIAAPPRLTGISPAYGANATATLVTITGSWFSTAGAPVVNLSASGYRNITMTATNLSATSFTVSVPNHNIAAVWNVTVVNPDGLEGTNSSVVFTTTDPPPVADFTFDTAAGLASLTVTFTDKSINEPTSWNWDFGDGDTTNATLQNPVHTYASRGVYSVTLNATNALGTGTKTVRKGIEVMSLAHENAIVNAGSDAVAYSNFGTSVALSGDGNTAIVGAENITLGVTPAGKAYVFTRSGGTWSRSAVLVPAESASSDAFGDSVALSSDGNIALVAAYHADVDGNTQAGQVYVFTRNGGSWTESAILNASSEAEKMAYFGNSVVLSDDGSTALIGAYMATAGTNSSAGKVYVFQKSGGAWSEKTVLTASDAEPGAHFGSSVALSRDGTTVVIGAESAGGNSAGRAYVFTGSSTAWSQAAVLAASDGQNGDKFGYSSAVSKNGDTLLVAAPWALVGGDYGGKAYVFTRNGSAWSPAATISTPENAGISDDLGRSLALSDDGSTALIGDMGKSSGSLQTAGQVYVIRYDGEGWYKNQILKASDAAGYDAFGWSIALRGTNALIGAAWATAGTTADAGQAYVFSVTTPEPAPAVTGISPSSVANTTATQVTITGTAFNTTGVPAVKLTHAGWSDVSLTAVSGTGTSLVRTVPAHIAAGTWSVVVTNPDGQVGTNSSVTFRVAPPVAASFTGTPLSGDAPLGVAFTDTSTGSPTSWSWDFGDGATSVEQNPSHTYTRAGVYTVVLTAGDGLSTDTKSVPGYITITSAAEPVIANFAAAPRTGTSPLAVSFTDQSRGGPVNWSWSFGDGGTSTEQNPVHTYTRTGSFSVALTAVNGSYSNTTTQGNYITVTAVPVTTVPVTTTPAAASGSAGADTSGDSGRSASYVATSPGAGAGGTMTFAVNEPLSAGSTGYSYAIRSVSMVPAETIGSTDLLVTDGGSTSNAPEGRALAGIVAISPVGVNPSAIRSGTITFAVPSAWFSAHGLAPADIVMMRYHDGTWAELPTAYQNEAGGACYFTATTPGFSYFAIASRAGAAANPAVTGTASPALTAGAVQTVTPPAALPASGNAGSSTVSAPVTTGTAAVPAGTTGSPGLPTLWILAGIGGIVIVAAGAVLVRRWWIRRQNPALFQEYD